MQKVILLKTESENSENYLTVLKENHFNPIFIPTLDFRFKNLSDLKKKVEHPEKYSGIIITSPRSIVAVRKALNDQNLDSSWKNLDNYCVGDASYELIKLHLGLETKGKDSGNASNLADFIKKDIQDKDVRLPFLFPCGNLKQDTLETKLSDFGYNVDAEEVYETIPHIDLEENLKNIILEDAILVFFSPSGVNYCLDIFNKYNFDLMSKKIVAIGPSTKKCLESQGYTVYRTSEKPSVEYLVKVLLD